MEKVRCNNAPFFYSFFLIFCIALTKKIRNLVNRYSTFLKQEKWRCNMFIINA